MAVCIAVVGKDNIPLCISCVDPTLELVLQSTVHSSLDVIDEKVSTLAKTSGDIRDLYIGVLLPADDHRTYGYVTNTKVKFLIVVDAPDGVIRENSIRDMFRRLHAAYIKAIYNPFYVPGTSITSRYKPVGILDGDYADHTKSPDLKPEGGYRGRSDTAQRLEKLNLQWLEEQKIKTIVWKDPDPNAEPASEELLDEMFAKKQVVCKPQVNKSPFSDLMEAMPVTPYNPFAMYSRYDASAAGPPTSYHKPLRVFMTMAENVEVDILVAEHAKVSDAVGLACWAYTKQGRCPKLNVHDVNGYDLHIAEEDGEVDWELMPLDKTAKMSKYGFRYLALAERPAQKEEKEKGMEVHYSLDYARPVPYPITKLTTVEDLLKHIADSESVERVEPTEYIVFGPDSATPLAGDLLLHTMPVREILVVPIDETMDETAGVTANTYPKITVERARAVENFRVNYVHPSRLKSDCGLTLTWDMLMVHPGPRVGRFHYPKPPKNMTLHMDSIVDCLLLSQRKDRAVVRLT
ncbi:unnamed protein product, partial [Cyprideis torosa]